MRYMNILNLANALNPLSEEQGATAAVVLLLTPSLDDFKILFVRRVENPRDPWSGQISLPGGKRDEKDENLTETVIRETREETGINLDQCQFLGVLQALISPPRPEMKILPFVVFCEKQPSVVLNKEEMEGFFWISLSELMQNRGTVSFLFGEFPAYITEENVIWGLTYRIVKEFIQIVD